VIRNIVVGRLRADADVAVLDAALASMRALRTEGMLRLDCGRDAGLREEAWDFAITADFVDADAYLRYDTDEEHNRIRRELFAPVSESIVRVQLDLGQPHQNDAATTA
jgi:hypothetical protein